jgi:hypothetical protein
MKHLFAYKNLFFGLSLFVASFIGYDIAGNHWGWLTFDVLVTVSNWFIFNNRVKVWDGS